MRSCILLGLLLLAGCASRPSQGPAGTSWHAGRIDCVPFARHLTHVALMGNSAEWWEEAEGLYRQTHTPEVGSILVFRRTRRLPEGHVSVVSAVLSSREILVSHANWAPGMVSLDQPVIDVSPRNDWTLVRVWWPPVGQMGVTKYPTYGFIVPPRPPSHQAILAEAPRAAVE